MVFLRNVRQFLDGGVFRSIGNFPHIFIGSICVFLWFHLCVFFGGSEKVSACLSVARKFFDGLGQKPKQK